MHYIYTLSTDFAASARDWREKMSSQYFRGGHTTKTYRRLGHGMRKLADVVAGDVVYVNTHGVWGADQAQRTGVPRATNQVVLPDGSHPNGAAFATFLKDDGLRNLAIHLKIWACFSAGTVEEQGQAGFDPLNTFAGQLCGALKATHPNLIVYGYKGETKALVYKGHKAAGLARPVDRNANPPAAQTRVDNDEAFELWAHRAKDHRVKFTVEGDTVRWT